MLYGSKEIYRHGSSISRPVTVVADDRRSKPMTPEIQSRVIDRLIDAGKADEPWALIVLAAIEGHEQLDQFLDKTRTVVPPQRQESHGGPAPEPPGAYVGSITVEGFRGVGPSATLAVRPGPGLTLVVGRNGSGKSSF